MAGRPFGIGVLLLLLAAWPAHAQVASLGKGWRLDSGGSVTSAPAEVISGKNSIRASGISPVGGQVTPFLGTDPTFVRFLPNQSYTMTFSYRIITADGGSFGYGFESGEGNGVGDFGPGNVFRGVSGSSGNITATFRLNNHGDYRVGFGIDGTGSIVIDDVRITDANGQVVASENAEGPTLAPGPLNFQLTDAIALLTEASATVVSAAAKDLDGDGYPETILTLAAPRAITSTTPLQPITIEASGRMRLATADFFPAGVPKLKDSPMTIFADINNDGRPDILFAEAGSDAPPFPGSVIGVAINLGGGKYRDVSSLIPADQQTTRSYAIAAGDVFGDGRVEIILPDENDGANTALLRWNGNGFDEIRNWIPQSIWKDGPALLHAHSWMSLADFDRDGRLDLLVTGQDHNPNFQIVFGGPGGFTAGTLVVLPDGPFGHTQGGRQPEGTLTTTEVSPVVVADFDNDGLPDIFAVIRNMTLFTNGCPTADPCRFDVGDSTYQVRLNQGSRNFVDVSPSPYQNLGRVEYQNLMTIDLNNDGFLDVVGTYATDAPAGTTPQWATTVFLNDGTGLFQLVDGAQFLGVTTTPSNGQRWNLGSFVPTVVTPQRTEGIVYGSIPGAPTGLNLYKVTANGSLGTGPNFVDPATLGVPGFNDFYYRRHHPDAAAAVQRGEYPSGLAHFLAVGKALGYAPHAPRAAIDPAVSVAPASLRFGATNSGAALVARTPAQTLRISQSGAGTLTWTASSNQPWLTVSPTAGTGPANLKVAVIFHGALPIAGQSPGSIILTFSGARISSTTVTVTLTTMREGSTAGPFGSFDTPAGDNAVLAGSLAVTGWTLDDVGVNHVELWRDLQPGETTPPFASTPTDPRNGKVFISNATFVDGARPDVEALYPDTPFSYRAGWGYLLLTWGLWNQGNGTYKLYAYAFDQEDHVATIGSKPIVVSNATATRPFGSIDTPGIGGDASGPNFGWGLTPKVGGVATCKIQPSGVQVSIDSGPLQPVVYGDHRTDIAGAFTGFSNSDSAGGHYLFDWSTLASGVHTIGWLITDDCNRADGVGSRFFNVTTGTNLMAGDTGIMSAIAAPALAASALRPNEPESDKAITVARGYGALPLVVDPGLAGSRTIEVKQGERIEVRLPHGFDTAYQVGPVGQPRALPAGSTWDAASDIFYWHPAAGFLGRYRMVFTNGTERINVRVVVVP
jgi:FG-GAP-like repeat/Viral BACON domain